MTSAFETTHEGFRVLGLRSAEVEVRCAPELGGRLYSLIGRRTGREWLWRRADSPELFRPADPRDFGTGTFAGLDECLPTVGACTWPDGRSLADHGEIWAQDWQETELADDGITLGASIPVFGLRLQRRVSVDGPRVRFDYALENNGSVVAPALWAMHPLFRLTDGDRLELPATVTELILGGAQPALPTSGAARMISYPEPAPGTRLDQLALADLKHGFLKCFTPALSPGQASAALYNPASGDRLEVRWDTTPAPYLGIWLTRGGYRGWHHVALEPTNAPFDRADEAAGNLAVSSLVQIQPGARRTWWVEWQLS
jgi:galactose mutarotase-like enzyme